MNRPAEAAMPGTGARVLETGPLTFARLQWTSVGHSSIYGGLLLCAFVAGKPEPLTFALGLGHGLLWIFMSLACIVAARQKVVTVRVAVAVAVLGGIGPFFGSYEFVRARRRAASCAMQPSAAPR